MSSAMTLTRIDCLDMTLKVLPKALSSYNYGTDFSEFRQAIRVEEESLTGRNATIDDVARLRGCIHQHRVPHPQQQTRCCSCYTAACSGRDPGPELYSARPGAKLGGRQEVVRLPCYTLRSRWDFPKWSLNFSSGCSQTAAKAGFLFNLMVNPVSEHELLNLFRSSQVDGVILMEIHLTGLARRSSARARLSVCVDRALPG